MRISRTTIAVAALITLGAGAARADGYPPFYGYSGYFAGPRVYFTPENDVRSASSYSEGLPNFGTRTYYRGGPFFHLRSFVRGHGAYPRQRRYHRRVALKARG